MSAPPPSPPPKGPLDPGWVSCAPGEIFVFGSNLAGRHGAGAALEAVQKYSAVLGQGEGLQGQSYAIPTKDRQLRPLSVGAIATGAATFMGFARRNPSLRFLMTPVGCGLAGHTPDKIAPLFFSAPSNVVLPLGWARFRRP